MLSHNKERIIGRITGLIDMTKMLINSYFEQGLSGFSKMSSGTAMKGFPEPSEKNCAGCAACSLLCPSSAINFKDEIAKKRRTITRRYDHCINCGLCVRQCPEVEPGVTMTANRLLKSSTRNELKAVQEFALLICDCCGKGIATKKQIQSAMADVPPEISMANPFIHRLRADLIRPAGIKRKKKKETSREDIFSHICAACRQKIVYKAK